jgi:hypothetical protein
MLLFPIYTCLVSLAGSVGYLATYGSLWERLQISKEEQFATRKIPFLVEIS